MVMLMVSCATTRKTSESRETRVVRDSVAIRDSIVRRDSVVLHIRQEKDVRLWR